MIISSPTTGNKVILDKEFVKLSSKLKNVTISYSRHKKLERISCSQNGPAVVVTPHQHIPSLYYPQSFRELAGKTSNENRLKVFSGTANPRLAQVGILTSFKPSSELSSFLNSQLDMSHCLKEIASYLGLQLGGIKIKRFADGEIYVQLQESVRGCDVFLVQPTCPPANENLMELLIMIDACRRASAKNITAVIPYFGYARADRKVHIVDFSFSPRIQILTTWLALPRLKAGSPLQPN